MKITDDILKALHRTVEGFGSPEEFAEKANVSINTIANYLSRKTRSIKDDTWEKIYPHVKPYLPKSDEEKGSHLTGNLTSDQKILLDAFVELPKELKNKKLIEMVELARDEIQKKRR
jgi:transcriptional regulator with XRE-family HTH domain